MKMIQTPIISSGLRWKQRRNKFYHLYNIKYFSVLNSLDIYVISYNTWHLHNFWRKDLSGDPNWVISGFTFMVWFGPSNTLLILFVCSCVYKYIYRPKWNRKIWIKVLVYSINRCYVYILLFYIFFQEYAVLQKYKKI